MTFVRHSWEPQTRSLHETSYTRSTPTELVLIKLLLPSVLRILIQSHSQNYFLQVVWLRKVTLVDRDIVIRMKNVAFISNWLDWIAQQIVESFVEKASFAILTFEIYS